MIKEKYKLKFFDDYVICSDLSVQDYLYLNHEPQIFLKKLFGEKMGLMNQRQIQNAISFLLNPNNNKTENNNSKNGIQIEDFFIIEGLIMKTLHQQRSEIRKWEWKYFQKISQNLDLILGEKKYEDYKNSDNPDKKAIKNLLSKK